jgi:hypothetical protein
LSPSWALIGTEMGGGPAPAWPPAAVKAHAIAAVAIVRCFKDPFPALTV